jgi:uncharacterized protein (DUF1697 family)
MNTGRHLALLRAINVGGSNIIKMSDLRVCFETMGLGEVATYIQSGNVIFSTKRVSKSRLTDMIEKVLDKRFSYESRVIVVSATELERVVAQAPDGFGHDGDRYRYDVLFVREPFIAREAIKDVTTNPAVDAAHAGDHALYFRRLISKASQSHLTKLVQRPVYKHITIRNWNTTTKLLQLVCRQPT